MYSIKSLSQYGFQVSGIVADGATNNNPFFEGMTSKSIDSYIPSDLKKEFKNINYNFKNFMLYSITDKPTFFLADMTCHTWLKNVNALEMSSLKKSKRNMKYFGYPLNSKLIQDFWRYLFKY